MSYQTFVVWWQNNHPDLKLNKSDHCVCGTCAEFVTKEEDLRDEIDEARRNGDGDDKVRALNVKHTLLIEEYHRHDELQRLATEKLNQRLTEQQPISDRGKGLRDSIQPILSPFEVKTSALPDEVHDGITYVTPPSATGTLIKYASARSPLPPLMLGAVWFLVFDYKEVGHRVFLVLVDVRSREFAYRFFLNFFYFTLH